MTINALEQMKQSLVPTYKKKTAWQKLMKNPLAVASLSVIAIFFVMSILAPWIVPYKENEFNPETILLAPNNDYFFGTDDQGRDILSRVIMGAQVSIYIGFFSVAISLVVGSILGLIAGYFGKMTDAIISRFFDIILSFPSILLAVAIVAVLGPGIFNALIAIAIVNIPVYGRLIRSQVFTVKNLEYIDAARLIGASNRRIVVHHILPNVYSPVLVQCTLGIGTAIIEAAALGFLGLGATPGQAEWGKMLADSRQYLLTAPWTLIFPGIAIILIVVAFNLLGDTLEDVLDPKMK